MLHSVFVEAAVKAVVHTDELTGPVLCATLPGRGVAKHISFRIVL